MHPGRKFPLNGHLVGSIVTPGSRFLAIVTELARVRLGHSNILPGPSLGQARSDVTYSCSSPGVGLR